MSNHQNHKIYESASIGTQLAESFQNSAFVKYFVSPQGLTIVALLLFLGMGSLMQGGKGTKVTKGKLANGRFGGTKELSQAKKVALNQLLVRQKQPVAVWIGEPTNNPLSKPPIYLPEANRSTLVMGAAAAGKTVSAINQIAISAIDQGFPVVEFDFKYPDQTSILASYAKAKGYEIHVFAPGFPESGRLNPITEFLDNELSGLYASQLAEVMNANFRKQGVAQSEDGYFGPAGNQLVKATLLLARTMKYPDLITCSKILNIDRLARRILAKRGEMNPWIVDAFGQFTSSAGSEKTESSIQSTAQLIFNRFQIPEVLSVLCGENTIPTRLTGKKMLILGLDQEKRDVLAPLFATIINLLVNRNMAMQRQDPIFFILDELPTLYLPYLKNWPNEHRSKGLCLVTGIQNKTQVEGMYGDVEARTIIGAFGTRIYMNPQDIDTAEWVARGLGDKEVTLKSRSRSLTGGKATTSYSEEVRTVPLISGSRINQMRTGQAIIINPHFISGDEGFVPVKTKIQLSSRYRKLIKWTEKAWDQSIRPRLIEKAGNQFSITEQDLIARQQEVDRMFPDTLLKKESESSDLFSALL
ncbi:transfer complex protein TrsK [Aphanothece hegewaldii CCALA 016]|uniref:Transfer complex protein TrsK n=1 Tax=Aphanothece hegewaldii CCALA 016 TaxID=2107694 RepID=A0A2T1LT04_9CHRO|nr:type IV secretion system DNA-binding domain-containing protein [Aphanothece hegewaldii]PSF33335.1 transfer complex protein TrsK [Aphanothece hegewaldii CCALA 016]